VKTLFANNDNGLCFSTSGVGPCHNDQPPTYPAQESDRMPGSSLYPGYFERNTAGTRVTGVDQRSRWPGAAVYEDPTMIMGRYLSPHGYDPDMPRQDVSGRGLCLNCHDPHGSDNEFDMLTATYLNSGGYGEMGPPSNFDLCLNCHGSTGPAGMNPEGKRIDDYYDASLNGDHAGHQIRMESDVAISWPSHLQQGDRLACYNCHNAHGSEGSNGAQPNAFLLSDQRPEWYGLTNPMNNADQNRRFCLGCHIPSDGMPGTKEVEGIVMNAIPDQNGHASNDNASCSGCHGKDYSTSTSENVHNPGDGGPGPTSFD
jgi:hypothetical protein